MALLTNQWVPYQRRSNPETQADRDRTRQRICLLIMEVVYPVHHTVSPRDITRLDMAAFLTKNPFGVVGVVSTTTAEFLCNLMRRHRGQRFFPDMFHRHDVIKGVPDPYDAQPYTEQEQRYINHIKEDNELFDPLLIALALECNIRRARKGLPLVRSAGAIPKAEVAIFSDLIHTLFHMFMKRATDATNVAGRHFMLYGCSKDTDNNVRAVYDVWEAIWLDVSYSNDPPQSASDQPVPRPIIACHTCGVLPSSANPLKCCAGCRRTYYCSSACQRRDWPQHKTTHQEE